MEEKGQLFFTGEFQFINGEGMIKIENHRLANNGC